jgi:DNA-binding NtrC family response regulator
VRLAPALSVLPAGTTSSQTRKAPGTLPDRSCQFSQFPGAHRLLTMAVSDEGGPSPPHVDGESPLRIWEATVSNQHILSFSPSPAAVVAVAEVALASGSDGIIGHSAAVQEVLQRVRRVAPTDVPVLITGETGTGKELLARAIHRQSRRATRPLVAVNLAAVPETLAAAELFGHERGAFTGADRQRIGRFEQADRGTLFLDEIGELRPDLQVMLLRVLQEGEFERLGGGPMRRVDVRVIAATNRDLEAEVQAGRFREDLFYRLNVFPIHLPPLRARREDIPILANYFLERAALLVSRHFNGIDADSVQRLQDYEWPGNIRQLQNVIEQSAIICDDRQLHVPPTAFSRRRNEAAGAAVDSVFAEQLTLEEVKKRYIRHLLTTTRGNMLRTAAILDVDRRSLYRMVARYQLGTPALHREGTSVRRRYEPSSPDSAGLNDETP